MTQETVYNEISSKHNVSRIHEIIQNTYSNTLGMTILSYEEGFCRAVLPVKKEFLNPIGCLHGGLLYTVADEAGGFAASRLETEETVTTISGTMNFFRAALDLAEIYVEARVVKDGKRIAFVESDILSADGTLYARGSFNFARINLTDKQQPEEPTDNPQSEEQ